MPTEEKAKNTTSSQFNLLDFFNNHSKKSIIALVILVGAAVTAAGALYYYREDLIAKVQKEELPKEYPYKNIRTFNGTIKEINGNDVVIFDSIGKKNVSVVTEGGSELTQGQSLAVLQLGDLKVGDQVSVSYDLNTTKISSLWRGDQNE